MTIMVARAEDEEMRQPLAMISYGWESPAFYRKWSGEDDPACRRQLASAMLEPTMPQSGFADALCDLFTECITADTALRDRFERHYRQFRAWIRSQVRRPPGGGRIKRR